MGEIKFKQSRDWWIEKDLAWIINNAHFIFRESSGFRPRIVTKEKMHGSDCFVIGNDAHGITVDSHYHYQDYVGAQVDIWHSNILFFLVKYLEGYGAGEFINPPVLSIFSTNVLNIFRKRKDVVVCINRPD